MNELIRIEEWIKKNTNNLKVRNKLFIAKFLVYYCSNSPNKLQYEASLEFMFQDQNLTIEKFLDNFEIKKDDTKVELFMEVEQLDEEGNPIEDKFEKVLIGNFTLEKYNELTESINKETVN
jgi:hypothetical protein